ncbi:hypothetical protein AZI87_07475 [Bdellovibrio bacteriovorus]|uniref:Uncharacterized protein n=1 Tax=Bdellovibrio bacteriovorus TaxID=959 RepID=A0A161PF34_BDEBC|nr:hypothetical protein [Bdellovibrio bacteriovorus]KYG69054.1 hypothetical protein AZI87_07475 [Bdellovibrio bacteriovorus]
MKISFYFKIAMMIVSLGVVLYAIRALQTREFKQKLSDPQSALGILIGSDYRPMNWCPPETAKVEIYSLTGELKKTLTSSSEISSVCEIMLGGFTSEGVDEAAYKKRLVALTSSGESKTLEQNEKIPVFRAQGMPFSSPMLTKALERLEAP